MQNRRLRRILTQILEVPARRIKSRASLVNDLGMDSLHRIELVARIEQEFGNLIDERRINKFTSVGDLARLLELPFGSKQKERYVWAWCHSSMALPARFILQRTVFFLAGFLMKVLTTNKEALQIIPKGQPVIFVANHSSHLDTVAILASLPGSFRKRTAVAAAEDYMYRNPFFGSFISLLVNAYPFSRKNSYTSLHRTAKLINEGWHVLFYPEGSRSQNGKIQRFKPGIGFLVSKLNVAVVPVRIRGTDSILPKGSVMPKYGVVSVTFGKPVIFGNRSDYRRITNEIEKVVRSL
ncbi:1-acyl-sn-glycerol-3-phosphate acyltransferase [Candidatus Woesearchaeota archaeon]|nr:1-acyl-sn-glycerol-3-phosphate acyltransferase [Candidatus Woesearchaeota archaeon]